MGRLLVVLGRLVVQDLHFDAGFVGVGKGRVFVHPEDEAAVPARAYLPFQGQLEVLVLVHRDHAARNARLVGYDNHQDTRTICVCDRRGCAGYQTNLRSE